MAEGRIAHSNPDGTVISIIPPKEACRLREVTIGDYNTLAVVKDQRQIAETIYHRLHGRYINPFFYKSRRYEKYHKHGFAMMASACLCIETIESFYQGRDQTPNGEGSKTFEVFFGRHVDLPVFQNQDFYRHVRCGILHQGETTGGFKINRYANTPLLDASQNINAEKFMLALQNSLNSYRQQLEKEPWDSECWDNLRRKMRFIIGHCSTS